jgi:hypothetical protein
MPEEPGPTDGYALPEALMNVAALLLLTVSILVLRTGERIEVQGPVRQENAQVIFRAAGGVLYSIPLSEVDREATLAANERLDDPPENPKRIKVSPEERERLLRELERNHSGTPAPREQLSLEGLPAPRSRTEKAAEEKEEWEWRRAARSNEEAVRRAKENQQMLVERAERLRGEIRGLLSLGFKPKDFTYQTSLLQYTLEQIPHAELEVKRAERALEQFREEARRQGIMPGWLR